ncbi:peptidyl-tRNA hydrolase [Mycena floridula]|nr:peptidyl-tRNA hydrolase [Mycena floridula]
MTVLLPQILVVGLGNISFPGTRHSVGQLLIDALAARFGIPMSAAHGGILGHRDIELGEHRVSLNLFKSKSFMNISGPSIATACRATVKSPNHMIVLSDSLSHNVETVSSRFGGSASGHNGLKSIISAFGGNKGFYSFRIGIGRGTDAATYVLQKMPYHEQQFWQDRGLDIVIEELERVVDHLAQ